MFEFDLLKFIKVNFLIFFKIGVFPGLGFIFGFVIFAVWYQRKYLARLMLRMGPVHCGRKLGWLQLIADALKLLTKELIVPDAAHEELFITLSILLPVVPGAMIGLIPFAQDFVIYSAQGYGLLLFFAISTLFPVLGILRGWAANNKFTIIGAFRNIYMDIAGEIPVILSAAGVMIWAGTYDLIKIVELQKNIWFIFPQILGFIVFFIGYLGMIEKVPFDIPTAESELVYGPNTEYTGAMFLNMMLSDYANMLAWTLLMITLYFGGYNGPMIFSNPIVNGSFWMLVKLLIAITIIFTVLITYARLRIDQAVRIGWNYLLPLALLNIFLTIFFKYLLLGGAV